MSASVRLIHGTGWGLDSSYKLRVFVSEGANIYFVIVGKAWIGGGLTNATIRLNDSDDRDAGSSRHLARR